jgi:quercetin dioxygenase-like cupin family protein
MKIVRIYTGDDGESHFEDVELQLEDDGYGGVISEAVKAKAVMFRETGGQYNLDYHTAPRRQYVVNLRGSVEIETGLGEKRLLGPGDILLAEDTTGRGHISRAVEGQKRECLFIPLA